jgi:23S rRNA (cytosine1962-C5)-methyltransferase
MTDPLASFAAARRRRDVLRAGGATDALRLLDGAGDGTPFAGLIIDDFAGRWLAQTSRRGAKLPAWLREVTPAPRSIYWKQLDNKTRLAPAHWHGQTISAPFAIREQGISYLIDFAAGYSPGIFLDQRDNRKAVRRLAGAGRQILNCFAYTCAFSVAAAIAGAGTVSVDLSRRSLDWGRQNFAVNGLDSASGHEFLAGDVFAWLKRFGKQGRRFDGIILDPPTFSRDRAGRVFRAEEDFGELVALSAPLLAPGGWMLCTTNQRNLAGGGGHFRRMIASALPPGERARLESAPMPPDFTGEPYLQTIWLRL